MPALAGVALGRGTAFGGRLPPGGRGSFHVSRHEAYYARGARQPTTEGRPPGSRQRRAKRGVNLRESSGGRLAPREPQGARGSGLRSSPQASRRPVTPKATDPERAEATVGGGGWNRTTRGARGSPPPLTTRLTAGRCHNVRAASSQQSGCGGWNRTTNLPVNSRTLYQFNYPTAGAAIIPAGETE